MLKFFETKLDYFIRTPSDWIIDKLLSGGSVDMPAGLEQELGQQVLSEVTANISEPTTTIEKPCLPEEGPVKVVNVEPVIENTSANATQAVVIGQQVLEEMTTKPHVCEELATQFGIQSEGLVNTCKAVVDTQSPLAELLNVTDTTLLMVEGGVVAAGLFSALGYYLLRPSSQSTIKPASDEPKDARGKKEVQAQESVKENQTWSQTHHRDALSELDKALIPYYNKAEKVAVSFYGDDGRNLSQKGTITPEWESPEEASRVGEQISLNGRRL